MSDKGKLSTRMEIHKFRDPTGELAKRAKAGDSLEDIARDNPDKVIGVEKMTGNCLLDVGIDYLWDIITGVEVAPTLWEEAEARVGVGSDNTPADPAQTGLIDVAGEYAAMDGGYPDRVDETVEFRGSFADTFAEFAWEEYTVDNGAVSGISLNRKVESKGTKGSGELWTLRVLITLT
jgi:hypothetical protein